MTIEKEGFLPLLREAKIAERYNIAIMSTKGLSVTVARELVDHVRGQYWVPLLVLHDFDKAGCSIVGTLQRDTRRFSVEDASKGNSIDVLVRGAHDYKTHIRPHLFPTTARFFCRGNPRKHAMFAEIEGLCREV